MRSNCHACELCVKAGVTVVFRLPELSEGKKVEFGPPKEAEPKKRKEGSRKKK